MTNMTAGQKQIALVVAGAVFTYIVNIANPPPTIWAWVLFIAGLGANVVNAVRALYNSSVTDERAANVAANQDAPK